MSGFGPGYGESGDDERPLSRRQVEAVVMGRFDGHDLTAILTH
jgi:hypothetical protein